MKIEKIGQGRPIIYLHDWGFTSQVWSRQIDFFRARYRNILVDYNLDRLPAGVTHESLLDSLSEQLMDLLQEETHGVIVAHGFGSYLAYELIERGFSTDALVLFGGLVRFTNDDEFLSGISQDRVAAMRKSLHENPRKMLLGYYQFAFSGADEAPPSELTRSLPVTSLDFLKMSFDTMISHDYREMVSSFDCQTLVVQGADDRVTPVWQGELIKKLMPKTSIDLCKATGHLPFITRYASVNRRVAQFLDIATESATAT